jgi:hypothetical protein
VRSLHGITSDQTIPRSKFAKSCLTLSIFCKVWNFGEVFTF